MDGLLHKYKIYPLTPDEHVCSTATVYQSNARDLIFTRLGTVVTCLRTVQYTPKKCLVHRREDATPRSSLRLTCSNAWALRHATARVYARPPPMLAARLQRARHG